MLLINTLALKDLGALIAAEICHCHHIYYSTHSVIKRKTSISKSWHHYLAVFCNCKSLQTIMSWSISQATVLSLFTLTNFVTTKELRKLTLTGYSIHHDRVKSVSKFSQHQTAAKIDFCRGNFRVVNQKQLKLESNCKKKMAYQNTSFELTHYEEEEEESRGLKNFF